MRRRTEENITPEELNGDVQKKITEKQNQERMGILSGPLTMSAAAAIGYSVLPGVGFASLASGAGSLHLAATSILASGAILVIPAFVLKVLTDKYVTNKIANSLLTVLITAGYVAGSIVLGAELFGINPFSLAANLLGGGITMAVASVGLGLIFAAISMVIFCSASRSILKDDDAQHQPYRGRTSSIISNFHSGTFSQAGASCTGYAAWVQDNSRSMV